ncbi:MAG TPA: hypothetical protein PKD49_02795 [Hyphomicrobium sp.]|nr:hypothetical protein [Hyphomicrobium sp.]
MRFAAALVALALSFCFVPPPLQAKAKEPKPFKGSEELLTWINGYRLKPEPDRLPEAVRAMIKSSVTKDMDQAGVYIGFAAGVLGSNPDKAEALITRMFPLDPQDQVLLIKAIAYSGLADWKGIMIKFVERMPARKVLIDKYLFAGKPTLENLPFEENSAAIDINWGYYFATGAEAPVRRIVFVLAWSLDRDSVEKLTVGAMAKWTLAQNASRDPDLLALLKGISVQQDAKTRAPLGEVIEAAETLELAKIRKEALASIEELKSKGPESTRNFNWWGQAGQTVFALGCVAAGALGQVEAGIPCVVGGALSNAALKYLAPGGQ